MHLEQASHIPSDVDRGVLVFNEHGLRFDNIEPAIKELLANSHIRHWIEIKTRRNRKDTIEELQEKTPDGCAVVTFGGDGSVNTVTEALKGRRLYNLFAGGGNATDVPLQLNDIFSLQRPSQVLQQARTVDIYPLEFTIEHEEEVDKQTAVGYVTGGTTPNIQRILELPEHREHPIHKSKNDLVVLAYEAAICVNELRKPENRRPFRVVGPNGEERTLMELMAVNGERMAKVGRFPVKLTDERFVHSEIVVDPRQKLRTAYIIGKSMVQLIRGTYPAQYIEAGQELSFYLPEDELPLLLQYDGELKSLLPGGFMRVRRAAECITALTTQTEPRAA